MLQLRRGLQASAIAVISLALLFVSYILVGWGFALQDRYSPMAVLIGTPLYFLSLSIALKAKMRPLVVVVLTLGGISGILIIFGCVDSLFHEPYKRWFPPFVLGVLAANLAAFVILMNVQKHRRSRESVVR